MKMNIRILSLTIGFIVLLATSCGNDSTDNSDDSSTSSSGTVQSSAVSTGSGAVSEETTISTQSSGTSSSKTTTSGKTGSTSSQPPKVDVSIYPATLRGKTVKRLIWDTPNENDKLIYSNFTKVTGCTVKLVPTTYDNYMTKLSGMLAANDAPDSVHVFVKNYPTSMTKNLIQPIDKYIKKDDPVLDFSKMNLMKYDNKYYGVASVRSGETFVVFFNKTMFDNAQNVQKNPLELYKAGGWTWDAFADLAQKMVQKDGSGQTTRYGAVINRMNLFMASTGIDFITVDGSDIKNRIKDPRVRESWAFAKRIFFESGIGMKVDSPAKTFAEGKAAMFIEGSWAIDRGSSTAALKALKDKWDWVPFPRYTGGKSYQPIEVGVWGVPLKSKNPEAGYYLGRWCIDPASLEGVEGAEKPHQYHTAADIARLDELYAIPDKYTTNISEGIMGTDLWDLWWDMMNPKNQISTAIDTWEPKINAHIQRVLNEIPKR